MILAGTELILWAIWFLSKETSKGVYQLARKVHKRRTERIVEYANEYDYLFDEYDGPDGNFLNWVEKRKIQQTLLIILIIILFIINGYFEDPSMY